MAGLAICSCILLGCGTAKNQTVDAGAATTEATLEQVVSVENPLTIEDLKVYFVPSMDQDQILRATEPLSDMMRAELVKQGFDVEKVSITVGTTYEAVGEALCAGTADVGFIPAGTYVRFDDNCDVILTATRAGLSKDSDNPQDWNDGEATEVSDEQTVSYRALFIAGPSEKGQELAAKVNAGEELTWEDLNSAKWSIMSNTSPAGYIYPALWLQDKYGKDITDLENAVQSDSYGSAFARLASGKIDVAVTYADARRDFATSWEEEYDRDASIWEETNVIGVTSPIYNDTVSVRKDMDESLKAAIQTALIRIGETESGKEAMAIYGHEGYLPASSADYDKEREAQELMQALSQ